MPPFSKLNLLCWPCRMFWIFWGAKILNFDRTAKLPLPKNIWHTNNCTNSFFTSSPETSEEARWDTVISMHFTCEGKEKGPWAWEPQGMGWGWGDLCFYKLRVYNWRAGGGWEANVRSIVVTRMGGFHPEVNARGCALGRRHLVVQANLCWDCEPSLELSPCPFFDPWP